ncbi:MAG: hypothetical protein INQ03_19025 [Candidatus Heimdallarchaeota archaeon]|nr:hypothetical protein [Candidatus Heimdallarchaeota archaeon]
MVNCNFHLDETANTRCQRCQRMICLLDKHVTQTKYSQIELCSICYYDMEINKLKSTRFLIFVLAFLSLFIILPVSMFPFIFKGLGTDDYFGPPLGFIIPFFVIFFSIPLGMGYFILKQMITAPGKAEQMRKQKEEFLQSLEHMPKGVVLSKYQPSSYKWSNTEINCNQCGEPISFKQRFCGNCGDPTDDEMTLFG